VISGCTADASPSQSGMDSETFLKSHVGAVPCREGDSAENIFRKGAIAQLGERLNGIQEVGGSTPPGSTTVKSVT
jgi:hypothetical protein